MNISGLDTDSYISKHQNNASALPNIGIAVSGGGYRAMLNGAGVLEAFDNRTVNATNTGQLGGLLQAATYLAGLSGGSWLVGSLYANNFTSIDQILAQDTSADDSGDLWQLGNSIFEGPDSGGIQLFDSVGYYSSLVDSVDGKNDAGFNTTITDYWGRALSYQLINATDGGPAYTWSSIAEQDFFTSGSVPLPIIVADSRKPGDVAVSTNTTIFTFDPWEMGSWDPTIYGFAPMKYVGTNFSDGEVGNKSACVTGYDSVGFVYGTSSTLFNSALSVVNGTDTTGLFSSALQSALTSILAEIGEDNDDIAYWVNPFYGYNNDTNPYAVSEQLTLVDGGEDDQNIPLYPLIQPQREVDVIFAVDSSADTTDTYPGNDSATGWPDGASLMYTYRRSLATIENGTAFPSIPDTNTFINLGLNNRPTFFGCDANNFTGSAPPLIVYLPNAPYVYNSNVSTYDLSYNDTQRDYIVANGYEGATQGNGTLDSDWPACVGCAILSRSLNRTGTAVPDVCNTCFSRYCWNGTINSTTPGSYVPEMKLTAVNATASGAGQLGMSAAAGLVTVVAAGWLLL
ncbi:Lysophospholipase, catalytic domain [Teratosphaeria destructans]|uniref:Lysophospholipase n=1 Tax=Teratosphaeria destructans TaxID=418781 RepID=A0A9W7SKN1_9PEZI|nr:Lysophospholipase, catalytic domain [Teratosphaeria destructans]